MNDIDQLRAVSDFDATHLVSENAFAELADQITAQPKASGGLRWRPAGLSVAAAVTAAALAAGVILTAQGHPARSGASPAVSSAVRQATTAVQLVAYATRTAAAESFDPQPNQWLYTDVRQAQFPNAPGHGVVVVDPRFKPVDEQMWAQVGGGDLASFFDGKLTYSYGGPFAKEMNTFGWPSLRYSYLESLPTSPARLTAIIESNLKLQRQGGAFPPGVIPADNGVAVFEAVQTLLLNVVVLPPRLQAGLYGVLAHDPAVRFHPSVTDYSGRVGAGFSASLDNGNTEDLIVVNTRTYAYMGQEQVALRAFTQVADDGTYRYHTGTILFVQAVVDAGIVQHPGQLP